MGGTCWFHRSLLSASGVRTAVPEGCGHWAAVGGDSGTHFGEHLIQGPDSRKTVVLRCENGLPPIRRTLFVLSYSFTLYSVHSFETTSLWSWWIFSTWPNCLWLGMVIDQTVFIVFKNSMGIIDVMGIPRALVELASYSPILPTYLNLYTARPLIPLPRNSP